MAPVVIPAAQATSPSQSQPSQPVPVSQNQSDSQNAALEAYLNTPLGNILEETSIAHSPGIASPTALITVPETISVAEALDVLRQSQLRCVIVKKRYRWLPRPALRVSSTGDRHRLSTPPASDDGSGVSSVQTRGTPRYRHCLPPAFGCLPSWDASSRGETYYRFFDVRLLQDLCYYIMRLYQDSPGTTVDQILKRVRNERVGKLANASGRVPFIPHHTCQPLRDVVAAFKTTCRVPVFHKSQLMTVLAPSSLLALFMKAELLDAIANRCQNMGEMVMQRVLTITESESLLKALALMERHGYSALPIVSEAKKDEVLDVISVRHVKYLLAAAEQLKGKDILNAPALVYLKLLRPRTSEAHTPQPDALKGPGASAENHRQEEWCFFPENSTLRDIFDAFSKASIHRLVLQDAQGTTTGMLTLSDTMRKLAQVFASPGQQDTPGLETQG